MKESAARATCVWLPTILVRTAALALLEYQKPSPFLSAPSLSSHYSRSSRRTVPYRTTGPCYCFNSHGGCHSSSCRFEHICSGYFLPGHSEPNCPEAKCRPKGCHSETSPSGPMQGKPGTGSDKAPVTTPSCGARTRASNASNYLNLTHCCHVYPYMYQYY